MTKTNVNMNKMGNAPKRVSLAQMQTGQRGKIVEINGGLMVWLASSMPWESE